jgi:hypothetical protein
MYVFISMDLSKYDYVELYLDSLDSIPTNSGYLNTDWPTFYLTRPLYNIAAIKVLQAEIPFSYYVINALNNRFSLTEPAGTATVTLPVGNYNSTTLSAALATVLTSTSSGLNGRTYTVTYNNSLEKFTITSSTGDFVLTFTDSNQTNPRNVIGFLPGTNTSSGSVLAAPYTSQISGPNYVYVNSTQIGSITNTLLPQNSVNLQSGQKGPQIARVPIRCNPGDVSFYKDPCPDHWFDLENLRQIQSLDLYLTLGNQAPEQALRLNGQNFSVKLGVLLYKDVRTVYEKPTPAFAQPTVMGSTSTPWRLM